MAAWRWLVSCCRSGLGSLQDSNPGLPSIRAKVLGDRWVLSEFLFLQQNQWWCLAPRGHSLLSSRSARRWVPFLLCSSDGANLPRAGGRPGGVPPPLWAASSAVLSRAGGGHQGPFSPSRRRAFARWSSPQPSPRLHGQPPEAVPRGSMSEPSTCTRPGRQSPAQ